MSLNWINNTIFISKIRDAGPVWGLLHDLIELLRTRDQNDTDLRHNMDLEFLHSTICHSDGEFQLILHLLSRSTILTEAASFLGKHYDFLNIKCVEIDSKNDTVNFLIHEKGQLQSEKTVPRGLSKHLIEEMEKSPMQGTCFSFTVPELFNTTEKSFIATLQDLKYNKISVVELDPDDDLRF